MVNFRDCYTEKNIILFLWLLTNNKHNIKIMHCRIRPYLFTGFTG